MIPRRRSIAQLRRELRDFPVVAILGARQVGKTTIARHLLEQGGRRGAYFDLESPADQARLADAYLALEPLRGLVVIDEIQRHPGLFEVLRVLADRPRRPARFLVLGSASPALLRQSSESLAGRIVYHELAGLRLDEVGPEHLRKLWFRGGFPASFKARSAPVSNQWRRAFVQTFLERDLPQLGITLPAPAMRRFWTMLAHYHGQIWNGSEIASSFGVSDKTVRGYLDVLCGVFVAHQLLPWSENLGKRQVKSPKIYLTDSGILHTLLALNSPEDLESHPKLGASWEGFALSEVTAALGVRSEECFFWATHSGAELDLMVVRGRHRLGFEFKRSASPALTPSMRHALADLRLDRLDVIHAGEHAFPLAPRVRAIPLRDIWTELKPL